MELNGPERQSDLDHSALGPDEPPNLFHLLDQAAISSRNNRITYCVSLGRLGGHDFDVA
jgi:hypothetical protein